MWRVYIGRAGHQDSDGVAESFRDGQGDEIETRECLEAVWVCGGFG